MPPTASSPLRTPAGLVGPLAALLAFALYSSHDALVKYLGASYSVFQILFFSALLSFPLAVIMLLRDPVPGTLLPRHPGWSLVRTLSMVTGWAGAFYAFSVLPMAQTYAMLFSTPLLITLLAIPVLGERVGWHRGLAVMVGLAGVLVVLRPGGTELSLGHAAALLAAFCSAMSSVVVRRIGRDERAAVLMLYPMVAAVLVMGALLPLVYVPVELADLGAMAVVAVLAFLAALLIIMAYRHAEASVVAPMQYSQMIWAVVFGWLFFTESPDGWTLAGAALIIASGLYILFREGRRNVSAHRPVLGTGGRVGTTTAPVNTGAINANGAATGTPRHPGPQND